MTDHAEQETLPPATTTTTTTATTTAPAQEGECVYCVECEDVQAALRCPQCGNDAYCGLCFRYLHKKGTRAQHKPVPLPGVDMHAHLEPCHAGTTETFAQELEREKARLTKKEVFGEEEDDSKEQQGEETTGSTETTSTATTTSTAEPKEDDEDGDEDEDEEKGQEEEKQKSHQGEDDEEDEGDESRALGGRVKEERRSKKRMSKQERKLHKKQVKAAKAKARRARVSASSDEEDEHAGAAKTKKDKKSAKQSKRAEALDQAVDVPERDELGAWVPMRLLPEERVLLHTLEGVLDVSEYTDKVDVSSDYFGWRTGGSGKQSTIDRELHEVLHLICGLTVAGEYQKGRKLLQKTLAENEGFFQTVFEIGRRYKIMNPDKMRTTYGKLMHMLMDYTQSRVGSTAHPMKPILTVRRFLQQRQQAAEAASAADKQQGDRKHTAAELLGDKRMDAATAVIVAEQQTGVPRADIDAAVAAKRASRAELVADYGSRNSASGLSDEDVERVVDSMYDAKCYLVGNRDPVDKMLVYLEQYFGPSEPEPSSGVRRVERLASLAIARGQEGARFGHDHGTQYEFVRQTLVLWREIQTQMFKLWALADQDLLASRYRLANTGQGLNRMQPAPRIGRAMGAILGKVQCTVKRGWVGLSVVHLGDVDVPNALFFIDKYTQVPRILGPLVHAVDRIDVLAADPRTRRLVELCGGTDYCKQFILRDFFRHGFNGSGSDGGSCVDGRLTSCWNWCSRIERKQFYPLLLATGFDGFDGSFA